MAPFNWATVTGPARRHETATDLFLKSCGCCDVIVLRGSQRRSQLYSEPAGRCYVHVPNSSFCLLDQVRIWCRVLTELSGLWEPSDVQFQLAAHHDTHLEDDSSWATGEKADL